MKDKKLNIRENDRVQVTFERKDGYTQVISLINENGRFSIKLHYADVNIIK